MQSANSILTYYHVRRGGLTVRMTLMRFGIIHEHQQQFFGCLVRKPIPTLLRVVLHEIDLCFYRDIDAISSHKIVKRQGAVIAKRERRIFKLFNQWSPSASNRLGTTLQTKKPSNFCSLTLRSESGTSCRGIRGGSSLRVPS